MSEANIQSGYILLSRKIIDSEIWRKPPLYIKVWIWLLEKAQHKEYRQLKRGQLFTRIEDIQDGVSWYIGYRKETPTKDQIYQIIDWMRKCSEGGNESNNKATMITTTKATHGMVITIDKYDYYQNPKNYESNNEANDEKGTKPEREQRQPDNINKNVNNDKNDNIIMTPAESEYITVLKTIKGYPLDIEKDIEYYKSLETRYPAIELVEMIKDYAAYKIDNPLKPKDNPRSQINTQCKLSVKWNKNLKQNSIEDEYAGYV